LRKKRHALYDELNNDFKETLDELNSMLEPFYTATNVIQSNKAGLLDVVLRFTDLYNNLKAVRGELQGAADIMIHALKHHWVKHVHQEAVYMCAMLSCKEKLLDDNVLFPERIVLGALHWFLQLTTEFVCAPPHRQRYKFTFQSKDEACSRIKVQYNNFDEGLSAFFDFRTRVIKARREALDQSVDFRISTTKKSFFI